MKKTILSKVFMGITMIAAASTLLSACGKAEYKKQEFVSKESQPNFRNIPAKVDIVLVADNTGSMNTALATVESQFSGFIQNMKSQYWDYRVAKVMISNPSNISRVLVNPELNNPTLPDGTPNPNTDILGSASIWTDSSQFLPIVSSINTGAGNNDHAYQNLISKISTATYNVIPGTTQHMLRQDALLAVIVLTNGVDITVDPYGNGAVSTATLANYANQISGLRSNSNIVRFYPVAAASTTNPTYGTNCLGGSSLIGSSYSKMITDGLLQGLSTNLCNMSSLSQVLSAISNDIAVVREAFVREYIVIAEQPIPGTIQVFKNGNSIPQSSTDGWEYLGGPQTINTITGIMQNDGTVIPFSADAQTGYVIKLNGSAKMLGSDSSNVTYQRP